MASCSQCVHKDICQVYVETLSKSNVNLEPVSEWISALNGAFRDGTACDRFKNDDQFVELPCRIGTLVYKPRRHQISVFKVASFSVEEGELYLNLDIQYGYYTQTKINTNLLGKTFFLDEEVAKSMLVN